MDYEDVKDGDDERLECIEGSRRDWRDVWPQDKASSLRGSGGRA